MIIAKELDKKANRYFQRTSSPGLEPVTVDELKTFARIDGDDEDSLLESFIQSVRIAIEEYIWQALIEQSWSVSFDWWPGEVVELPRSPLLSVDSIVAVGEDGTETVYSSSNYYVVTDSMPGKVVIKSGASLPTNNNRMTGGFKINFTCGYGSAASSVPAPLRTAVMQWATAVYEMRAMSPEPPPDVKSILRPFKMVWY